MTDQELREKQKIVLLLTQMQAKLDAAEQSAHAPIAVIGIGCRMPGGADSADAFWDMLEAGTDAVIEVPPERWDADAWYDPDPDAPGKMNTKSGGFLRDVDKFDAEFFGIAPREAISMDPQQRLVLEVAWRALEHADLAPASLAGSSTGVFLGICTSDYARMGDGSGSMGALDTYSGTGGANGVAAGRLSYTLGLQGPSLVVDTACSSSLVASHLAVQSLRSGECRLALAGGVNLVLLPDGTVTLSRLHMMAPDGRCKAFDAAADGFVRGEGCGIVVLKRLADAQADGDRVLAVIRGSAVNQDGRSAGLTAPSGLAQQAVVRAALADAGVQPADIAYVEAHGTGTALGDPVEINALTTVLGSGRSRPLLVGSVKTNIGHLEAAAGIAGLIKAIETVRRGRVAPSLHFHQINPHIRSGDCPLIVPTASTDLAADAPHLAGVSAFGFSGTNAHMVLERAPAPPSGATLPARRVEVLALSAKSARALEQLKEAFIAAPALERFADACFSAAAGRSAFAHRIAVAADGAAGAIEQLRRAGGRAAAPRIAFLFSGQGAQASGMGQQQYASEPVFRAVIDRCAAVLDPLLGRSLTALMFQGGEDLNRTEFAQPALLAFELAMVALLRSWGVEPEALIGHSLGEYGAAAVAEALPLEDALRLVALRGRLMQALPAGGAMAAVLAGRARVDPLLAADSALALAADNGPGMVTLSGPLAAVENACATLERQGIEVRRLQVSHAFHSALMDPALDAIEAAAAAIVWQAPRIPLIGNVDGALVTLPDAAYWRRHTRAPVAFADGMRRLAALGCNVFVEVGPSPVLLSAGRSCIGNGEWIAAARHGQDATAMEALARLFEAGVDIRWDKVHAGRGRRKLTLPGHPLLRQSYWRGALGAASGPHPLLVQRVDLADGRTVFRSTLPHPALAFLSRHRVGERAIAPAAALLEACASAARRCGHAGLLSDLRFEAALALDQPRELTIEITADRISLQSRPMQAQGAWTQHLSATLGGTPFALLPVTAAEAPHAVDPAALLAWMRAGGIEHGAIFQRITRALRGDGVALAQIAPLDAGPFRVHPAMLDAAFQALAVATFETGDGVMRIPAGLDYFEAAEPASCEQAWAHVRMSFAGADPVADVLLCDAQGRMIARAGGLRLARAGSASDIGWQDCLLERVWRVQPVPLSSAQLAQAARAALAGADALASLGGLGLAMDAVCAVYAAHALAEVAPGTVVDKQRALYRRLPLLAAGAPDDDPDSLLAALRQRYPDSVREIDLLQRCGSKLCDVLQGRQDPLQLLFPEDGKDNVYRDSPVSRALNRCVEDAVLAALPAHGPLRILEVGAGTGGTTDGLLQRLPAQRIEEYAFTDISPTLLAAAGRRHAAHPWLTPRRLDIDADPQQQGFAAGHYDIIVAANVIHAGADLQASLQRLTRLLAPNGAIVLLEGAGAQGWIDLVFGLTEGWWRFADHARRPDYPLPDRAGWLTAMDDAGLEAAAVDARIADVLDRQVVLVGRRRVAGRWLVAGGEDALTLPLAEQLQAVRIAADAQLPDGTWQGCVFTGALQMRAAPDSIEALMTDQQQVLDAQRRLALACSARGMRMAVVTAGAHAARAEQATAWGLGRAIAVELPDLELRLIDVADMPASTAPEETAHILCTELQCRDGEDQIAYIDGVRHIARLISRKPDEDNDAPDASAVADGLARGVNPVDPAGACLITGGFGGLGLHAARWLARRGATCLVLMGRSAPSDAALAAMEKLESEGITIFRHIGDVGLEADVRAALALPQRRIAGIVHAAGTLDDGVLAQLDWPRMERVLRAKVAGAWLLDRLAGAPDFFLLYSSAVGLVGSRGQANHVAANAYLDALAAQRRANGCPAVSIAWGAWRDIGSATDPDLLHRLQASGMDAIVPAQAAQVLDWTLRGAPAGIGVLPIRWPAFARALDGAVPPVLRALLPALPKPRAAQIANIPVAQTVAPQRTPGLLGILLAESAAVLGASGPEAIDPARSLFDLGMDSLMAVELRNRLQIRLERSLPSTLLFDHPTPSDLAAFLGDDKVVEAIAPGKTGDEPIAIIGMDCRFPGGASDPERFWELLCAGFDAIGDYPQDRDKRAMPGRQGAFLEGVDRFDAAFFRIAPREAASMDPQQRLLLETAWHALERAGHAPDNLAGSATGVFIGVCNYDYPQLVSAAGKIDAWSATGGAPSIVAGRLAYVMGLEGPAMVVDTACSSSLVTVHLACRSLLAGDCSMALAGGVNLILAPSSTDALSELQMLAPDARCKAFDTRADGFVRGEGCGVIVLKRLSDALADGDNVLAVIRGSYVNQDGRSPSLTAPSGRAQESVIRHALARAGVKPDEVGYVETHGTGTQLGDPIEMHALKAVFGTQALVIGAVKSNIGHLEAAAGIAGLIKATLAIGHGRIPPNLHFTQMNPHIALDGLAAVFPQQPVDWPAHAGTRVAGVSAFGFSGTNAHIVLEQAEENLAADVAEDGPPLLPQLLIVSGATAEAARAFAQAVAECLEAAEAPALRDLAYTLIAGRAQLGWRIAVVAENGVDAARKLRAAEPLAVAGRVARVGFFLGGETLLPAGMAQHLYASQPVFRAALDEVAAVLEADVQLLLAQAEANGIAQFAVCHATCSLLSAWGIQPDAFIGESFGEELAALHAHNLTLPEAIERILQGARGQQPVPLQPDSRMPVVKTSDDAQITALDCSAFLSLGAGTVPGHSIDLNDGLPAALAALYLGGSRLSPKALRATGARLQAAPVYPFERQRHWVEPAAAQARASTKNTGVHPLLGTMLRSPGKARHYQSLLSCADQPWLAEHRVADAPTLPAAAMLEIMAATACSGSAVAFSQISFSALLDLSATMLLQTDSDNGQVSLQATPADSDDWRAIASGTPIEAVLPPQESLASLRERFTCTLDVAAFYAGFEQSSAIGYGPAFRTISALFQLPGQALARLTLPAGLDSSGIRLHPALLDGAFQSVGAAAAEIEAKGAYLPAGIRQFVWSQHPAPDELWAWTQLSKRTDGALSADIALYAADGTLIAHAESLLLQPVRNNSGRRACVHDLAWRSSAAGRELPRRWHLTSSGTVHPAILPDLAQRLLASDRLIVPQTEAQAVLMLAGDAQDLIEPSAALLALAQELLRQAEPPQVWIAMLGRQPAVAAVSGFAASLRLEHPALTVTVIGLPPEASDALLLEQALSRTGNVLAAAPDGIVERQLVARAPGHGGRFALRRPDSGQIQDLVFESAPAQVPGPGEVAIAVAATGLNFRDVMNVLGTYPGAAGRLGGECAGYVTALGENVQGLQPGQPVMAITSACHASHALAPASLVLPLPRGWSMEQAGSSPTVFLTAAWALRGPGAIAAGQRVLIHAGSGGLGLAAIQVARAAGAEVLATAGSEDKRAYLRALGVACVSDSRSLAFVDAVRAHTAGQGVDIVLNALSGDLIAGGFAVLRAGGRFLEAGKAGIWSDAEARACRPDVSYHRIALDQQIVAEPERVGQFWRGLLAEFNQGLLTPLPVTGFALQDAPDAYRYMQHARQIGRIALTRRWLRRDAAYLVTGGTGALGLATAGWLIERGAGHVVLAARSAPDARVSAEIERFRTMGAEVHVAQADMAEAEQVRRLLASLDAPLAGVIHAAGVLDDGVLESLTPARIATVFGAKVLGAMHLDAATRGLALDFFVLFSSAAGVLGSAGQTNYAAANAALDGIAAGRRAQDLPALSIDWGAWAGAGLAAQRGAPAMAGEHALEAMENLIRSGATQAVVLPVALDSGGGAESAPAAAAQGSLRAALLKLSSGEQRTRIASLVRQQAATILSLPHGSLDPRRPLNEYGLDSLMAVELRNALAALADTRLPSSLLFDYPNIEALADFLAEKLGLDGDGVDPAVATPTTSESATEPFLADVEPAADLTEDQLAEALMKELDRAGY